MSDPSYLWLAPYAGLSQSFQQQQRLVRALHDAHRQITVVTCRGVFRRNCPVMSAKNIPAGSRSLNRLRTCHACQDKSNLIRTSTPYRVVDIDAFITKSIDAQAAQLIRGVNSENYLSYRYNSIDVGRYSTYLAMLHHKVHEVSASEDAWDEYMEDLEAATKALLAAPTMFSELKPTCLIVENPFYPINRVLVEYAQSEGLEVRVVTTGTFIPFRGETIAVYGHPKSSQTAGLSSSLQSSLTQPLSQFEVGAVGAHLQGLIQGSDPWVYSAAPTGLTDVEVRERLNLHNDREIVAVMLSSPDETRAAAVAGVEFSRDPQLGYASSLEFVQAVLKCAEENSDLDFVFRLHPRMLPNKRESKTSPDLMDLLSHLENTPPNVRINRPEQGLSLYDLMRIASCAVNHSSSTGLEFMAHGIPVINYDPMRNLLYPDELTQNVPRNDICQLSTAVRTTLDADQRRSMQIKAFRWMASVMLRAVVLPVENYFDDWGETTPYAPETLQTPQSRVQEFLRSWSPKWARKLLAQYVSDRQYKKAFDLEPLTTTWGAEFIARLDSVSDDIVWEPLIIFRGVPLSEADEWSAVERTLMNLLGCIRGKSETHAN